MRRRLAAAAASVAVAGSALFLGGSAAPASASVVSSSCVLLKAAYKIDCFTDYTGYGSTAAAAEANAATYAAACYGARTTVIIAGPELLSDGQWYVEYSETCVNNIE